MHPNQELISRLYAAFDRLDHAEMASCYATNSCFTDPLYSLAGRDISAMWAMLCTSSTDLRVSYKEATANNEVGSATWEAHYMFKGERHVNNIVQATFVFKNGLITKHHDEFDFWRWSKMALGLPGLLLGWSPFLKKKVKKEAMLRLEEFKQTLDD